MSFAVEDAVAKSCEALFNSSSGMAADVIDGDKLINSFELDIDNQGRALYALGQPVAVDLRLTTMVLKANTDLERMGDHAVNIAEKALYVMKEKNIEIDPQIEEMARITQTMLRSAMDSFIKEDVQLAKSVLKCDDEVDSYNENLYHDLSSLMEADPSRISAGVNLLMISHNLERIADLACNIAEDVIYWKQGREIRHGIGLAEDLKDES